MTQTGDARPDASASTRIPGVSTSGVRALHALSTLAAAASLAAGGTHPAVRLPGDFEPQRALLLACRQLDEQMPNLLADVVRAVGEDTEVIGLVSGPPERRRVVDSLKARGIEPERVRFLHLANRTAWIRDYGPLMVETATGEPILVDPDYYLDRRASDDDLGRRLAKRLGMQVEPLALYVSGGNLLSNGRGLALATYHLVGQNLARGLAEQEIRERMREALGIDDLVVLDPLRGEITGHVDLFATFTGPGTVVVGAFDPAVDPTNASILDRNAERLARVSVAGAPLRVVRIPMPPHDRVVWRTYTNVIYANGVLLMPSYPGVDDAGRTRARAVYTELLPDRRIVEVDASALARYQGSLRCATMSLGASALNSRPAR